MTRIVPLEGRGVPTAHLVTRDVAFAHSVIGVGDSGFWRVERMVGNCFDNARRQHRPAGLSPPQPGKPSVSGRRPSEAAISCNIAESRGDLRDNAGSGVLNGYDGAELGRQNAFKIPAGVRDDSQRKFLFRQ
jgi:hypothetical protein